MPITPDMAKRYPADWPLRCRFIIQYRAANRCEWCRAENGQPHPDTGSDVVLTLEVWPESHWPGFALRQADVLQSYMS